jgi:hypothetical protein
MDYIKCPRCGDVIPLRVTSCPTCGRCPSCGRRNRNAPAKCLCDYPDSELALHNLFEYHGVPERMVEVERRRIMLRRNFSRQTTRVMIGLVVFFTALAFPLMFLANGVMIWIALMLTTNLIVSFVRARSYVRLLRDIEAQARKNVEF